MGLANRHVTIIYLVEKISPHASRTTHLHWFCPWPSRLHMCYFGGCEVVTVQWYHRWLACIVVLLLDTFASPLLPGNCSPHCVREPLLNEAELQVSTFLTLSLVFSISPSVLLLKNHCVFHNQTLTSGIRSSGGHQDGSARCGSGTGCSGRSGNARHWDFPGRSHRDWGCQRGLHRPRYHAMSALHLGRGGAGRKKGGGGGVDWQRLTM